MGEFERQIQGKKVISFMVIFKRWEIKNALE